MAFTMNISYKNYGSQLLILNKHKNIWQNTFINHQKLVFPVQNEFRSFGSDFMVKIGCFFFV